MCRSFSAMRLCVCVCIILFSSLQEIVLYVAVDLVSVGGSEFKIMLHRHLELELQIILFNNATLILTLV